MATPARAIPQEIDRPISIGSSTPINLRIENRPLPERGACRWPMDLMVGRSASLERVQTQIARVAPTDATVLITGESGTGKELVARDMHLKSNRFGRPFVRLNCASIPPTLIASELFGHEKGAFTGADQRRLGRFEMANGGTIFLDEIGEVPAETQVALLRVLQEKEIERVGGSRPIAVDVRVVAATNRDLRAAVVAGTFRLDLFYRLNVFPIHVPPLRERADDIPLLVEYFVDVYAAKCGKRIRMVPRETMKLLQYHSWPGNIRELQNVIERAVILGDGDELCLDETWVQSPVGEADAQPTSLAASRTSCERELITAALQSSRGRISGPTGAAIKLGMPPSTLESRILRLGIDKRRFASAAA
jgi:formate hydrogenlyase transcriptional activator